MKAYIRIYMAAVALGLMMTTKVSAAVEILITSQSGEYIFDGWLKDRPTISFSSQGLSILSPEAEILLEEVRFAERPIIEFKENADGILTEIDDLPLSTPAALRFQYTDGQTVTIGGVKPDAKINLYSIDGKAMPADADQNESLVKVRLGHLPQGYYIIRIDNQTFKIYKR